MNSEFIYETAPFPTCHASTIVDLANGDLLAAWFGGSREGADDVAIWISRRTRSGWSAPEEFARHEGVPCWNPVLFQSADGVTWLYYKYGPSPRDWTGGFRYSMDDGRTWSPSEPLAAGLLGPIKNKPYVQPGGAIISGTSVESYQAWACWAERSIDHGRTWRRHGPVSHPRQPYGIIQPAIAPIPGGGLRMFARARNIGMICRADSFDGGITWSDATETTLPNPNSGIDAVGLRDGRIVIIYNHTPKGRTPLNAAVSSDGGETWKPIAALESEAGEYSYPAVIQARNGDVHTTYTWKRERIKHVTIPLGEIPT